MSTRDSIGRKATALICTCDDQNVAAIAGDDHKDDGHAAMATQNIQPRTLLMTPGKGHEPFVFVCVCLSGGSFSSWLSLVVVPSKKNRLPKVVGARHKRTE